MPCLESEMQLTAEQGMRDLIVKDSAKSLDDLF